MNNQHCHENCHGDIFTHKSTNGIELTHMVLLSRKPRMHPAAFSLAPSYSSTVACNAVQVLARLAAFFLQLYSHSCPDSPRPLMVTSQFLHHRPRFLIRRLERNQYFAPLRRAPSDAKPLLLASSSSKKQCTVLAEQSIAAMLCSALAKQFLGTLAQDSGILNKVDHLNSSGTEYAGCKTRQRCGWWALGMLRLTVVVPCALAPLLVGSQVIAYATKDSAAPQKHVCSFIGHSTVGTNFAQHDVMRGKKSFNQPWLEHVHRCVQQLHRASMNWSKVIVA